jgi:hypothetical protein
MKKQQYELVVEKHEQHQFIYDTVLVHYNANVSNAVVYVIEADQTQIEQLQAQITERELTFTLNRMD